MKFTHAYAVIGIGIIILAVGVFFAAREGSHDSVVLPPQSVALYENASSSDIVLELPFPGAVVGKTFSLVGKARGGWYFEASFPARVVAEGGQILWQGPVTALGEWMTSELVPFNTEVKVPESYIGKATIILENDNPSGMPENQKTLSVPITVEY